MSGRPARPSSGTRRHPAAPDGTAERTGRPVRHRAGDTSRDRPERADRDRTDRVGGVTRPVPVPPSELVELDVGPVAHRGLCVARAGGRVVFVRHALPGERVRVRITDVSHDRYWRADAVEILVASPDRVAPPCPHARPGGCGGCDWQHATPAAQRRLKARVVEDALRRLAGLERAVLVEALPSEGPDGLGWRTRMRFSRTPDGGVGLRAHRSHEVVPTPDCKIAHPLLARVIADPVFLTGDGSPEVTGQAVELVAMPGDAVAYSTRSGGWRVTETGLAADAEGPGPDRGEPAPVEVVETVEGREFRLEPGVFWQVHPAAAATLVAAVREAAAAAAGDTALDLYCGAGLFAAFLAEAVGPTGRVIALESDEAAVRSAARSLADLPWVSLRSLRVTPATVRGLVGAADQPAAPADGLPAGGATPGPARRAVDVAVLDPPRTGAGREVMTELLAHRPRRVVYVACDPAALARDVAVAAGEGYRLTELRAFDLFPMTSHVECVATLEPAPGGATGAAGAAGSEDAAGSVEPARPGMGSTALPR